MTSLVLNNWAQHYTNWHYYYYYSPMLQKRTLLEYGLLLKYVTIRAIVIYSWGTIQVQTNVTLVTVLGRSKLVLVM